MRAMLGRTSLGVMACVVVSATLTLTGTALAQTPRAHDRAPTSTAPRIRLCSPAR